MPSSIEKAVYHEQDQRYNLYEVRNEQVRRNAESVAVVTKKPLDELRGTYQFHVAPSRLAATLRNIREYGSSQLGDQEKYREEPVVGHATAFLVGKQLVLTAAHVVCKKDSPHLKKLEKLQKTHSLIFGVWMHDAATCHDRFPKNSVYKIQTVVAHRWFKEKGHLIDWALVKLDKEVVDRRPLSLNCQTQVFDRMGLYMLGHPSGLPMKYAYGARVTDDSDSHIFKADLDAFGGNSGSPVFNSETHEVVGILIEGEPDFEAVDDYRGTGQRRIQAKRIENHEREKCQRVGAIHLLSNTHLVDAIVQETPSSVTLLTTLQERFYLKKSCIGQVIDRQMGWINRQYQESLHRVSKAEGVHLKQNPSQPMMEYAVRLLMHLLSGYPLLPTQLVRFETECQGKKIFYPVLLSQTIEGPTLQACDARPPLDSAHFTWTCLSTLLFKPGDGRGPNYVLSDDKIICVDNDIAFVEPVVREGLRSKKVNFSSILFFMDVPLDQKVLDQFCNIDPIPLFRNWLEEIRLMETSYLALFTQQELKELYTPYHQSHCNPLLLLPPRVMSTLLFQFRRLQTYIRMHRPQHPLDLLKSLVSLNTTTLAPHEIGEIVYGAYSKTPQTATPAERLKKAISIADQSLSTIQAMQASLGKIPSVEEVMSRSRFTSLQAVEELNMLEEINREGIFGIKHGSTFALKADFKNISPENQKQTVQAMTSEMQYMQPRPQVIFLTHCTVLQALKPFLHTDLTHLELQGTLIKQKEVNKIVDTCKKIKILNLSHNPHVTTLFLQNQTDLTELALNHCPKLKSLSIRVRLLNRLQIKHCAVLQTPQLSFDLHNIPRIDSKGSPHVDYRTLVRPLLKNYVIEETRPKNRSACSGESKPPSPTFPLEMALRSGDIDLVALLLDEEIHIQENGRTRFRFSIDANQLLFMAVDYGQIPALQLALDRGANVNQKNEKKELLITYAAESSKNTRRKNDMVLFLLKRGADPHAPYGAVNLLHWAVEHSDPETIQFLLNKKVNTNLLNYAGNAPLRLAIELQLPYEIICLLIEGGADPTAVNPINGKTALHLAARKGDLKVAQLLMQRRAHIQATDHMGDTPIEEAIRANCAALVGLFLDQGIDPSYTHPKTGKQCIHLAAEENSLEVFFLLLARGIQKDCKDAQGNTSLKLAVMNGSMSVVEILLEHVGQEEADFINIAAEKGYYGIVRLLLEKGAERDHLSNTGKTPIEQAVENGYEGAVQVLLTNGANPNQITKEKRTLIQLAAVGKRDKLLPILLQHGADPRQPDLQGRILIVEAAAAGSDLIVDYLLKEGIDPNSMDRKKNTPLLEAARKGHEGIVSLLLKGGALPNHQNLDGETALHLAFQYQRPHESLGARIAVGIFSAIFHGLTNTQPDKRSKEERRIVSIMYLLIFEKADVNIADNKGERPIHKAVRKGYPSAVELLAKKHASLDSPNLEGKTPGRMAIEMNNQEILSTLVRGGLNPFSLDNQGEACIHIAAAAGKTEIVRALLQLDSPFVDPILPNVHGEGIEHLAAERGHTNILQVLLDLNVLSNAPNRAGQTPLALALQSNQQRVARFYVNWEHEKSKICFWERCLNGPESCSVRVSKQGDIFYFDLINRDGSFETIPPERVFGWDITDWFAELPPNLFGQADIGRQHILGETEEAQYAQLTPWIIPNGKSLFFARPDTFFEAGDGMVALVEKVTCLNGTQEKEQKFQGDFFFTFRKGDLYHVVSASRREKNYFVVWFTPHQYTGFFLRRFQPDVIAKAIDGKELNDYFDFSIVAGARAEKPPKTWRAPLSSALSKGANLFKKENRNTEYTGYGKNQFS